MKKIFTAFATLASATVAMYALPVSYAPQVKVEASEINDEVIFDAPEGELSWLARTCDGFVTEAFEATHSTIRGSVVQMVEGEDGYVYLSHMASEYPVNTWTRFQREGNTLVMEGIQAIYVEYDELYDEEFIVYLAPMEVVINENNVGTFKVPEDCRFVFNVGEDGTLTSADPKMLLGVCVHTLDETLEGNDVWIWKGFGDRDIKMAPAEETPVSLPEGIDVDNWVMSDGYVKAFVQVAIDGEDFYVNGVDRSLPDSWIKGTMSEGKVIFPSGQYLGADMEIYYYSYFYGAEFSDVEDEEGNVVRHASLADKAVFTYDAEANSLTADNGYIINSTADKLFPLYFYEDVTIGSQNRNPLTAPAAPYDIEYFEDPYGSSVWFQLPNVDVDGKLLLIDNLYYEIYVNGQLQYFNIMDEDWNEVNTSRIPYMYDDFYDFWVYSDDPRDHTVYLYTEGEVKTIGIRSIYVNENGEDVYSELGYYGESGLNALDAAQAPVSVKLFDLQGREICGSYKGVAVKVSTYADGSARSSKVILK